MEQESKEPNMPSSPDLAHDASTLDADRAKWLINGARDHAIFMFDSRGTILTWNPGVESILGYAENEWIGRNVSLFYTPEDVARSEDVLERERAAGEGRAEDLRWHVRRDGTRLWADGSVTPVYDNVDTLIGFAKIMRDATARKHAQMALWNAEERLRLATSAARIGTFDYDPRTDTLSLDDRCRILFGLSPDEARAGYKAFLARVHPDDYETTDRALKRVLAVGSDGIFNLRYRTVDETPDATERWLSAKGQASFDGDGVAERFVGSVVDVTINQTTGESLRQREEFLRRILESSADCIKTLNLDGTILNINQRGVELLEVADADEVCGAEWVGLWAEGHSAEARNAIEIAREGGTGRFQGYSPTMKGTPKWWDVAVTPIRDAEGAPEHLLVISRDITVQHNSHEQRQFFADTTERLHNLTDPEDIVQETVRAAGEFFRLSRFLFAEVDDAADTLKVTHEWTLPEDGVETCSGAWGFAEWGRRFASWGTTRDDMRAGSVVVIADFATDPRTAADFATGSQAGKMRAAIAVPLLRDGKWVALFSAQTPFPREWMPGEIDALIAITGRVWLMLENARLERAVQGDADREREHLTGIFMQAPAFMAALRGPTHIFELANPPYYALVGKRDIIGKPVREALPEVASQGFMTQLDSVYRTGIPFIGKDISIVLHQTDAGLMEERYLDFTFQPLYSRGGDVSGILVHGIDLTDRKRLEQERERLHEEQGRLLAATSVRAEREAILNQIGEAVRSAVEPEEIVAIAVSLLGKALALDRCFFNAFDAQRTILKIGADWHRPDLPSIAGKYSAAVFERVVDEFYGSGNTVVFNDIKEATLSQEARAVQDRYRNRALLGVALRQRDSNGNPAPEIVATLGAAMTDAARIWSDDDIGLVESVATSIQTATETVRIRQRERNIAVQLQEALIPHAPPKDLPGLSLGSYYQPALDEAGVGGDAFDVFRINADSTALCVFDLSGKGLTAASQVATVKNMLRFAVFTNPDLAAALRSLNQVIVDHDLLAGFATLFIGIYDHTNATFRYVNCGQEPGIIWRAATRETELLMPTGPVLGGFASGDFEEREVLLAPDNVLALFTDGLTEVGATRKNQLEIEGVCAILKDCVETLAPDPKSGRQDPDALVACLIESIDAFAQGGVRDDIALLIGVVNAIGVSTK